MAFEPSYEAPLGFWRFSAAETIHRERGSWIVAVCFWGVRLPMASRQMARCFLMLRSWWMASELTQSKAR